MKELLRRLFDELLPDLDPAQALAPHLAELRDRARGGERFLVLAYGKAARAMAQATVDRLPGARLRGLVVPPEPDAAPLPPFDVIAGGHPLPTAGSLTAGHRALELARGVAADETVLFLASGGGSAMLEAPLDDAVTLAELRALNQALVGSGADIVAINTVRQGISALKGGRLAFAAHGARELRTLEIRDVPSRCGAVVASGPSTGTPPPPAACRAVLDRFALWPAVPASLAQRLLGDTAPSPTWPSLPRHVLGNAMCDVLAAEALAAHARAAGLRVVIDATCDDLPYAVAAERLLRRLGRLRRRHPGHAVALVAFGELSVPLPASPGIGGRNQQFALHCARLIRGRPITVLSCGTDGIDGNSPAAGAVVDGTTCARARRAGLSVHEHLRRCDAHRLLAALGDAVVTGPTGTNVRDVRLLVHSG